MTSDVFAELQERPRAVLKTDTQGHDLSVFEGSSGCLDRVAMVMAEMQIVPRYQGVPSYLDALRRYEERGFVPVGFYENSSAVLHGGLHMEEMNCLLVNAAYA